MFGRYRDGLGMDKQSRILTGIEKTHPNPVRTGSSFLRHGIIIVASSENLKESKICFFVTGDTEEMRHYLSVEKDFFADLIPEIKTSSRKSIWLEEVLLSQTFL